MLAYSSAYDFLYRMNKLNVQFSLLGGTFDKSSLYIDLTILSNVSPEDSVMQEEIFGPILPIINVNSALDAIEFINAREKPLTLYLFSEDKVRFII